MPQTLGYGKAFLGFLYASLSPSPLPPSVCVYVFTCLNMNMCKIPEGQPQVLLPRHLEPWFLRYHLLLAQVRLAIH